MFIPRRDTSSWINTLVGGRLFPGRHFHAKFDVKEKPGQYHIAFTSSDGTSITVDATDTERLTEDSIFPDLPVAAAFFERGTIGYSPNGKKYDGLALSTQQWKVTPLAIQYIQSSFFENEAVFPKGSVVFDNALLMKEIKHEWRSVNGIKCI